MGEVRACDGCTLCCKVVPMQARGPRGDIIKDGETWCRFCDKSNGCTIYDERPDACRIFRCVWLDNPSIPDSLRPDRSGVVLEPYHTGKRQWCIVHVNHGADIRGTIGQLLYHLTNCERVPLTIVWRGRATRFAHAYSFPPDEPDHGAAIDEFLQACLRDARAYDEEWQAGENPAEAAPS